MEDIPSINEETFTNSFRQICDRLFKLVIPLRSTSGEWGFIGHTLALIHELNQFGIAHSYANFNDLMREYYGKPKIEENMKFIDEIIVMLMYLKYIFEQYTGDVNFVDNNEQFDFGHMIFNITNSIQDGITYYDERQNQITS